MQAFIIIALTNKARHGMSEFKRANLRKEVLQQEPYTVKYILDRNMQRTVRSQDIEYVLSKLWDGMFIKIIGKKDIDYKLEVVE